VTVRDLNGIQLEDIRDAIGPHRGDLLISWLGSCDQNLSARDTERALRAVRGIGPKTIAALEEVVEGMPTP
jgi:hypothetical protein